MAPGEIARSLNRLEKSQADQTETLGEIKEQTTKTNGRVTTLEREMRDLKRDHRVEHHDAKRATDRPDIITLSIPASMLSTRKITTVVAALIAGLIAAWRSGLFQ